MNRTDNDGARRGGADAPERSDLEHFVQMLRRALETVQMRLRDQQESWLRRLLDTEGEGGADAIPWQMAAADGTLISGEVPAAALRNTKILTVTQLTIELDCTVEMEPDQPQGSFYLIPVDRRDPPRKRTHRVCIALRGAERPAGEITVDGEWLREIPASDGTREAHHGAS